MSDETKEAIKICAALDQALQQFMAQNRKAMHGKPAWKRAEAAILAYRSWRHRVDPPEPIPAAAPEQLRALNGLLTEALFGRPKK